jgi:hypothetical protein
LNLYFPIAAKALEDESRSEESTTVASIASPSFVITITTVTSAAEWVFFKIFGYFGGGVLMGVGLTNLPGTTGISFWLSPWVS